MRNLKLILFAALSSAPFLSAQCPTFLYTANAVPNNLKNITFTPVNIGVGIKMVSTANGCVLMVDGSVVRQSAVPSDGQILAWSPATGWTPVSAVPPSTSVVQQMVYDDLFNTQWFTGDVLGTFGKMTVAALQGFSLAKTTPTAGQVLTWNAASNRWEPQAPANVVTTTASTAFAHGYAANPQQAGDGSYSFGVTATQGQPIATYDPAGWFVVSRNGLTQTAPVDYGIAMTPGANNSVQVLIRPTSAWSATDTISIRWVM